MTVRALDENHDIVTSGSGVFISGKREIAQTIHTRLNLLLAEYFRDITDGTQWFEVIMNKSSNQASVDAEIKRRILQTEGVQSLTQYSATFDNSTRELSVSAIVLTAFGQIEIQQVNGV